MSDNKGFSTKSTRMTAVILRGFFYTSFKAKLLSVCECVTLVYE